MQRVRYLKHPFDFSCCVNGLTRPDLPISLKHEQSDLKKNSITVRKKLTLRTLCVRTYSFQHLEVVYIDRIKKTNKIY